MIGLSEENTCRILYQWKLLNLLKPFINACTAWIVIHPLCSYWPLFYSPPNKGWSIISLYWKAQIILTLILFMFKSQVYSWWYLWLTCGESPFVYSIQHSKPTPWRPYGLKHQKMKSKGNNSLYFTKNIILNSYNIVKKYHLTNSVKPRPVGYRTYYSRFLMVHISIPGT